MNYLSNVLLLSLFLSTNAFAQWQLAGEESNVNFISIKNSNVGEVHHFTNITGSIDKDGEFEFAIDLTSVETNIEIRNDRMKSILFETEKFPSAVVNGAVDVNTVGQLKAGDTFIEPVKLNLSLHGLTHEVTTEIRVTKLSNGKVLMTSVVPIIINASDFGLANGLKELQDIAKLPLIDTAVPVTFSLIFQE